MPLSRFQQSAIQRANDILQDAQVPAEMLTSAGTSNSQQSSRASTPLSRSVTPSSLVPCPAVSSSLYIPPPARNYTPMEITQSLNRINRRVNAQFWIEHPLNAIVEYPQTGQNPGEAVAHFFPIDPVNFVHPKSAFQYSLGDAHGGRKAVQCYLLGRHVKCNVLSTSCKGIKFCSAYEKNLLNDGMHWYTNRSHVREALSLQSFLVADTAIKEVFTKTLAFFCALQEHGCCYKRYPN